MKNDIPILQKGVHVIVGTPGRVCDMIKKKYLNIKKVKMLILDEADEMLGTNNMLVNGMIDQIYDIKQRLPRSVQICLSSSTLNDGINEFSERFMQNPVRILVKRDELTLDDIRQFYITVEKQEWKFETLCDLYDTLSITSSIIFCNSRKKVDWLTDQLGQKDFTVSSMHGDMSGPERELIMKEFRSGSSRILITTDQFARGIGVQQVSLVIKSDNIYIYINIYTHHIIYENGQAMWVRITLDHILVA